MTDKKNTAAEAIEIPTHSEQLGSAPVDFAQMGLNQIAYIRRAIVDDVPVWSIHAATGDTLGAAQTFEQAWGAIKQNNLEPMRVH